MCARSKAEPACSQSLTIAIGSRSTTSGILGCWEAAMQRSLLCALARGGISSDKTTNRSRSVVGNLRVAMDKDRVRHSRAFPHRHGQRGTIGQYFQELHTGQPPKFRGQDPPRVHISAARPGKPWFFVAHGKGLAIEPRCRAGLCPVLNASH